MEALILFSTCPTDVATEIGRKLVQAKLAACVNIIPAIQSIYRWQDAVEEAKESLLMIKTSQACYPALEAEIQNLHPYETPEIIVLPIAEGSKAYMQWLLSSCIA